MSTYEDNMKILRELRQTRNTAKMAKEISRMARQVNQRLYRLEKKGLQKDSYGYQRASLETGKEKPRYSVSENVLSNMGFQKLYELGLQLNVKIYSKTTTIRGVKEVQEERITKSIDVLESRTGLSIERKTFEEFLKSGGGELLNNRYLDSTQIIEDFYNTTKDTKVTVKEFIREFTRFKKIKSQRVDYGRIKRNLKNLKKRRGK
jgi:hypothetical protein